MVVAAVLLGSLTLYPLSIGPAAVMVVKGRLSESIYTAIYSPLGAVCARWRPAHRAINWYGRLWLRASGE
jgi:hypothetical protein